MSSSVMDIVRKIVSEHLGVEPDQITPTAAFIDDLGADSLDIVEIVLAFEDEFHIEIPDEDAEKIQRVQDACDYIIAKAGKEVS